MAKYWQPGAVKTRLGRDVGMQTAALIHRALFTHLTGSLSGMQSAFSDAGRGADAASPPRLEVVISPVQAAEAVAQELAHQPAAWQLVQQCDGDLGHRMRHWFSSALSPVRHPRAILVGVDCPLLMPEDLWQAEQLLDRHDVVLGPALDGGYYLIGLAGPDRAVFDELFEDIPWSSADVLRMTRDRAAAKGLSLALLETRRDVDDRDDLEALRQQLAAASASDRQRHLGEQLTRLLGDGAATNLESSTARHYDEAAIQTAEPE